MAIDKITTPAVTDDSVTLAKMAPGTDGNIISYDASGNPVAIATGNDGQVLTSTGAGSPPAFEDAGGGVNTPSWSATMGSNQSISANSITKLNFNTEQWDIGTGFNTSNYNYTVPSGEGGKYVMTATVTLHNAASGSRVSCYIFKGGSELALKNSYSSETQDVQSSISFSAILAAGDVLDVRASTNQSSPQFDAANSFFSGFKIIE